MRAAACRRSGPRLREAWALLLHLSARPDVTLQMDAREGAIEMSESDLATRALIFKSAQLS
jgi:hypothetical protein